MNDREYDCLFNAARPCALLVRAMKPLTLFIANNEPKRSQNLPFLWNCVIACR